MQAAHALFHFKHPSTPCRLGSDETGAEINAITREPVVLDFVDYHLAAVWGSPIFGWGDIDRVCDLLFGRLKLFMQFDVDGFIARATKYDLKLKRIPRRELAKLRERGIITSRGFGVAVDLPNGGGMLTLNGDLARIHLELARPETMLRMLPAQIEEAMKIKDSAPRQDRP